MKLKLTAFVIAALLGTVAQAAPFKEIVRSYTAKLNPNNGKTGGTISIICDTAKLVIGFVDPGDPIPTNNYDPSTKTANGYQPFSTFPLFLDLLRNGSPVSVSFDPDDSPPLFIIIGSK